MFLVASGRTVPLFTIEIYMFGFLDDRITIRSEAAEFEKTVAIFSQTITALLLIGRPKD